MSARFCYWSIGTGGYTRLLETLVASARAVGVTEDFHVWSDGPVAGAIDHPAGQFDNWGWLFKLVFLRREVARLDYEFFVYLDADSWFVRHPGDPERLILDTPMHATLEADLTRAEEVDYWWDYPTSTFVALMRDAGLTQPAVYNVNGGMFILRRSAIETMYSLALGFWRHCRRRGVLCVDEPLIAYAMQMLCDTPENHTLTATHDFWATDTNGAFANRLPDGRPFRFRGFHKLHDLDVNPAIVHLVRGKAPLFDHARRLSQAVS